MGHNCVPDESRISCEDLYIRDKDKSLNQVFNESTQISLCLKDILRPTEFAEMYTSFFNQKHNY